MTRTKGIPLVRLPAWVVHDPATVEAMVRLARARVLRFKLSDWDAELREQPPLVLPDEFFGDASTYRALAQIGEVAQMVIRAESEIPTVSVELARERGFSEAEIDEHLRPWIAEGKAASEAAVKEAEQKVVMARAEAKALAELAALGDEEAAAKIAVAAGKLAAP